MDIYASRLPSESTIIKVLIFDDTVNLLPNTIYKVVRVRTSMMQHDIIAEIDPNVISPSYIVNKNDDKIVIELLDNTDKYGTEYLYKCVRIDTDGIAVDATSYANINTLPQKVEGFKMVDEKSIFDRNTGIPTSINFKWDAYDTTFNNFDVVGFHIYYSVKDRANGEWNGWQKLRGTTTYNDSYYAINFIDKTFTEIDISVPQLADYDNPKDMKFAIVAVTGGASPLQSRFSRIETFSFQDTLIYVAKANVRSTVSMPEVLQTTAKSSKVTSLALSIHVPETAFSKDTAILVKKTKYDDKFDNFDYSYTYELRTSNDIETHLLITAFIPITSDSKYEVRILKNGNWVTIPSTYNRSSDGLGFQIADASKFVILVKNGSLKISPRKSLESIFNDYTRKIIDRLPSWFKIRRNPATSNGAYFLDAIGIQVEELKFVLDYAERQIHLATADVGQVDIVYKAKLPDQLLKTHEVAISSDGFTLERTNELEEFLKPPYKGANTPEVYYNNQYIIDYDKRVLYTRQKYNPTTDKPYGEVEVSLYFPSYNKPYFNDKVQLELHHIWNFFDEFGMLLNTPRLIGEKNSEYKERLFDVFKNKSNSSRVGLMNGIARELGIRINKVWQDNKQDFIIKEPMVIANMIKVDGKTVPLKDIWFTSDDFIVIKANPNEYSYNAEVTYVSGLEMHTFNNKNDHPFQTQLYNINGTATNLFRYYVDTIKQRVPVEWGQFKWNEGYWDAGDASVGGYGYLPSIMDAKFTGFRPVLIDLIGNPKPMHITLEETIEIIKYDKRSML